MPDKTRRRKAVGQKKRIGRPPGDRVAQARGYRARVRDVVRAKTRGIPLRALIDEGLDATNALEEAVPGAPPLVTLRRALAAYRERE